MSNCIPCSSGGSISVLGFNQITPDCGCDDACGSTKVDARCVKYTGPRLNCIDAETHENLEEILIKIDTRVCTLVGDYSSYNMYCLDDTDSIINERQFVEKISESYCVLRADFDSFKAVEFEAYKVAVNNRFLAIENPQLTSCASVNLLSTDNIKTVLTKLSASLCSIYAEQLALSSINWSEAFTVDPFPTNIPAGFSVVINQIKQLKNQISSSGAVLPTFNNIGSCLPAPLTAIDSLESTVGKIKTRLCQSPTFDINDLTWGCTTKPSSLTIDLQGAFQAVLTKLTELSEKATTFSGDFVEEFIDNSQPCLGKTISLSSSPSVDRYVGSNGSDVTPGTLIDKLQAGTNVTLDDTTTPGKVIINSTGGIVEDTKVKINAGDTTTGYLADKLNGITTDEGTEVVLTPNGTTNKIDVAVNLDGDKLWDFLLEYLDANPDKKAAFCERVTSCLPDCIIPPNVTVIYNPE